MLKRIKSVLIQKSFCFSTIKVLVLLIMSKKTGSSSFKLKAPDMVCQGISIEVYFLGIKPAQIQLGQSISQQVSLAIKKLSETLVEIFPPSK